MKKVIKEKTENTPQVNFNNSVLSFEGRFLPTEEGISAINFFGLIIKGICNVNITTIEVKMDNLTSPVTTALTGFLGMLAATTEDLIINWYYKSDDQVTRVKGEHAKSLIREDDVIFTLIESS